MKITILYDNYAFKKEFKKGWGFSALLGEEILFDTGEKGRFLLKNIKTAGFSLNTVKRVVLSHDHWDHWGGLWKVLKLKEDLPVHVCPGFTEKTKTKILKKGGQIVLSEEFCELEKGVFTTGELWGTHNNKPICEQSLIIKTEKGVSLITGCAHPGIITLLESLKEKFPRETVYAVIGGFHLYKKESKEVEAVISKIKEYSPKILIPTHCSGSKVFSLGLQSLGAGFGIDV